MGDLKNIFDYLQLLLRYFVAGVVSILVIAFTDDTARHFFYSLIQKSPYILLFIAATVGIILTAIHHAILDDFFFEISIRCYLLKHKMPEKLEKSSRDWSKSSIKKSNSKTTSSFKFSLYSQTYLRRRSSNFDILSLENELKFKWSFLNLLYCSTYSMLLIPILIWKVRTYQNFHSIHSFRIGFDLLSGVVLLIAALKYDYRITKREIWIAEYFFQTTDAIEFQTISFTIPKSISPDFVPFVAGDFNKWNTSSHPMMDDLSGNWTIAVKFQNREIKYAILVNGNEIASKNVILTYIP